MRFTEAIRTSPKSMMHDIYLNAYQREIDAAFKRKTNKRKNLPEIVFYGVKTANTFPKPTDKKQAEKQFRFIYELKRIMPFLTFREFMTLFPIEGEYDGDKWGVKDCYSTLEAIKELKLQPDEEIGEPILEILTEYMNTDIIRFNVKAVTVLSAWRRFNGHLDLFEEFMASQGMETDNTFKNSQGEAMYVRNGKPVKVEINKPQHSHLKLVKKGV